MELDSKTDYLEKYFKLIENTSTKVRIAQVPINEYFEFAVKHNTSYSWMQENLNYLADVEWDVIWAHKDIVQQMNRKLDYGSWQQPLRLNEYYDKSITWWQKFFWQIDNIKQEGQRCPIFATQQTHGGWVIHPGDTRQWVLMQSQEYINVFYTYYNYELEPNGSAEKFLAITNNNYTYNEETSFFIFGKNYIDVFDKTRYNSAKYIKTKYDRKVFKKGVPDDYYFFFTNEKVVNDAPSFFEFFDFIELRHKLDEHKDFIWGNFLLTFNDCKWNIKWHTRQN
jgi:hypothetical protein